MDLIKNTDLKMLIEASTEWCISIYMPTHRTGREQQQDPIRFKNLISQAQKELLEYGVHRTQVETILKPVDGYISDRDFWQHQSDGLAVFLSPDSFWIYRLPERFDEMVIVSNKFHIKPLVPQLRENAKFYILTLSMNDVRLFFANRNTADEIDLGDFPTNIQSALQLDEPEKYLGYHTKASSPGRQNLRRASFYGHGEKANAKKTNLLRYFQQIDRRVNELIDAKNIPMVLIGVGYLLPIYHQANTYNGLSDHGLEGNPDELDAKTLHEQTWELIAPVFKEDQDQAVGRLVDLLGQKSNIATTDLKKILNAAYSGLVDALFVVRGAHQWGRYLPMEQEMILEPEATVQNEDLLDFAVTHTILNSGKAFTIDTDTLSGFEIAAILRYPA